MSRSDASANNSTSERRTPSTASTRAPPSRSRSRASAARAVGGLAEARRQPGDAPRDRGSRESRRPDPRRPVPAGSPRSRLQRRPGGQQPGEQQIGVGGQVDALDLQIRRRVALPVEPAIIRSAASRFSGPQQANAPGPVRRDQPQVGGDRRRAEGQQGRQPLQDPGRERLHPGPSARRAVAAGHQVAPVPPQAEVDVAAVADPVCLDLGGERGPKSVPESDRPDRRCGPAPRCRPPSTGDSAATESSNWPARVLGVELLDLDPLGQQRVDARRGRSRTRRSAGPCRTPGPVTAGTKASASASEITHSSSIRGLDWRPCAASRRTSRRSTAGCSSGAASPSWA